MKKALLVICILFSVHAFGQSTDDTKKEVSIEEQIKELDELKKQNKLDRKKLKAKMAHARKTDRISLRDTVLIVEYDFSKGEYIRDNVRPHVKSSVVYKISNINRLAYDVTIKAEDIIITDEFFNPEAPAIDKINDAKNPVPQLENEKIIPALTVNDSSLNSTGVGNKNKDKTEDQLESNRKGIEKLNADIDKEKTKINKHQKKIDSDVKELNNLELGFAEVKLKRITVSDTMIAEFDKKKGSIQDTIDAEKTKRDSIEEKVLKPLYADLKDRIDNYNKQRGVIYDLNTKYKQLLDKYKSILKAGQDLVYVGEELKFFKETIALLPNLTPELYIYERKLDDCVLKHVDKIDKYIKVYESEIDSYDHLYNDLINDWENFYNLNSDVADNIKFRYQMINEEVKKVRETIKSIDIRGQLIEVTIMDKILLNGKSYEVYSAPVQALQDYIAFDIEIKSKNANLSQKLKTDKIQYREYARGGVRFDFSVGTVFDFQLDKNDNDDDDYYSEYAIKDTIVNNIAKKKIVGVSRDSFKPSLAGMFHTSFRTAGTCSFGLTLGASLNVETFDLNSLFPGVSLLVGKNQKFIFTVGAAFKKVDLLKKNYSLNEEYDPSTFNDGTTLTSSQYKIGLFFGITYNLTSAQRGKIKVAGK